MNDRALAIYINMHKYGQIRNVFIGKTPWFVATDVTNLFCFPNPRVALTDYVDGEDKRIEYVQLSTAEGGAQNTLLINESAIYSLAFNSTEPSSRKVKRWITQKLIPTLYEFIYTKEVK